VMAKGVVHVGITSCINCRAVLVPTRGESGLLGEVLHLGGEEVELVTQAARSGAASGWSMPSPSPMPLAGHAHPRRQR